MKRYQGEDWKNFVKSAKQLEILQYTISLNDNVCIFVRDAEGDETESSMHWLSDKEKSKFLENEETKNTKKIHTKSDKTFYTFEHPLLFNNIFQYNK